MRSRVAPQSLRPAPAFITPQLVAAVLDVADRLRAQEPASRPAPVAPVRVLHVKPTTTIDNPPAPRVSSPPAADRQEPTAERTPPPARAVGVQSQISHRPARRGQAPDAKVELEVRPDSLSSPEGSSDDAGVPDACELPQSEPAPVAAPAREPAPERLITAPAVGVRASFEAAPGRDPNLGAPSVIMDRARAVIAAVKGDTRPFAPTREPCARCGTRGDIGCDHQQPFGGV